MPKYMQKYMKWNKRFEINHAVSSMEDSLHGHLSEFPLLYYPSCAIHASLFKLVNRSRVRQVGPVDSWGQVGAEVLTRPK